MYKFFGLFLFLIILNRIEAQPSTIKKEAKRNNIEISTLASPVYSINVGYNFENNFHLGLAFVKDAKEYNYSEYGEVYFQNNNIRFPMETQTTIKNGPHIALLSRYFIDIFENWKRGRFYATFILGRNMEGIQYKHDVFFGMGHDENDPKKMFHGSSYTITKDYKPYYFMNLGFGIQLFPFTKIMGLFIAIETSYPTYLNMRENVYTEIDLTRFYFSQNISLSDVYLTNQLYKMKNENGLQRVSFMVWLGYTYNIF